VTDDFAKVAALKLCTAQLATKGSNREITGPFDLWKKHKIGLTEN
jgi:hypothetical protein